MSFMPSATRFRRVHSILGFILLIAYLCNCTSAGNRDSLSSDSSAVVQETEMMTDNDADPQSDDIMLVDDADGNVITTEYEALYAQITGVQDSFLSVTINSSQYEASFDATWYFDKSFLPVYYHESWNLEGTEGTVEYLVQDNLVMCAQVENYNGVETETTTWCRNTGGEKKIYVDNPEEPSVESVSADFASYSQQELRRYLDILKSLLREGEITTEWEDAYMIRVENVMNAGPEQEVVEYTEVTIPKELYDEFVN